MDVTARQRREAGQGRRPHSRGAFPTVFLKLKMSDDAESDCDGDAGRWVVVASCSWLVGCRLWCRGILKEHD